MKEEKNRYAKWRNKYTKTRLEDFKIEGKEISYKSMHFMDFEEGEEQEFEKLADVEKNNFLNGAWNFYMAIND